MNSDMKRTLNTFHQPFRLTALQAAYRLGFTLHEVKVASSKTAIARVREFYPRKKDVLAPSEALTPLGTPRTQATKFYAELDVATREKDEAWLDRALRTVRIYRVINKKQKGQKNEEPSSN